MPYTQTIAIPSIVRRLPILTALVGLAVAHSARADFNTLSQRLPAESDAIIAVNINKVLATPYARQHKWAENVADAWARKPVMIPPGSERLLMAAGMKASAMESAWEISLVEMKAVPPLDAMLAGEGGHMDRVWDRNAVVSPVNAYFVPLDNNVLATITPAERQFVVRWVRTPPKPEGSVNSAYLREIVTKLNETTDITLAIDLEGAISPPKVQKTLAESSIKELAGKDLAAIARTMASLRGASLTVSVGDDLRARAVMDFAADPKDLQSVAKPITIEALDRVGFALPDAANWTYSVEGKQVIAQGNLSETGVRLLMGLIQSPIPAATVASAAPAGAAGPSGGPAAPPAATAAPLDPAHASARYYKSVAGTIDYLGPAASASAAATSLRQAAKRIDQLPILNVDQELVAWGASVSFKLKQAAGIGAVTQTNINSRVAAENGTTYGSYRYDSNGNYTSEGWDYASQEAVRQRGRSAAAQQKAEGQKQMTALIDDLSTTRTAVRGKMVAKYQIEF